jgi:hypothetical protein
MAHPAFKYLRAHTQTLTGMAALDFGGGPMSLADGQSSERVRQNGVGQLLRPSGHTSRGRALLPSRRGRHTKRPAGRGPRPRVLDAALRRRSRHSRENAAFVFVPIAQQPITDVTFFVRHDGNRPIARDVRAALTQVERGVPVLFVQSLEEATALGLLPQRLAAWIAGGVGATGLFLAALGLYGLMAFLVAQRTREIAIRMALGASRHSMQMMVMTQAARLGIAGAGVGLAFAGGLGMLMRNLLVGVPPIDLVSFGAAALIFLAVLTAASWSPSRRAATTDPAVALRAE